MGKDDTNPDDEEQDVWEDHEDFGNGVKIKVKAQNDPVLCAVFDGDERVTAPSAALQVEQQHWAAEAYADAKEKYQ